MKNKNKKKAIEKKSNEEREITCLQFHAYQFFKIVTKGRAISPSPPDKWLGKEKGKFNVRRHRYLAQ